MWYNVVNLKVRHRDHILCSPIFMEQNLQNSQKWEVHRDKKQVRRLASRGTNGEVAINGDRVSF